ncbi:MAG: glycosyltransferase family 61 protein [Alphaproteobacteria bacterium]|nr:MAG: glycosyltransferase family 61 protein [Alphaproteobacteria bacterium]
MVLAVKNAICLPCTGAEDRPLLANGAYGGIFTHDRAPVREGFLVREYRQQAVLRDGVWDASTGQDLRVAEMILPGTIGETRTRLEGTYIFAGYIFPHYGHFLLESLSRLWFYRDKPHVPLLWMGVHNQTEFNAVNQQLFELFGITNPMHIVTEQTEVEELLVPEAGYIINSRYTGAQADALRLVGARAIKSGKKVWLSRSKLSKAKIFNEPAFERLLRHNGWTVYHPQDHRIADQLDMLSDAELIAGVEGSAFHTLVLMPDYTGKIYIIARGEQFNLDYASIAHSLGLDQRALSVPRFLFSSDTKPWQSNWLWPNFDILAQNLGLKRPNLPWTPFSVALRNIVPSTAAFFKSKRLIEFWPRENSVASLVPGLKSTTVAEVMDFDLAPLDALDVERFELTPDQYFQTAGAAAKSDLYCIRQHDDHDALVRAFNNSLSLSDEKTIWIIEGCDDSEFGRTAANENFLATIQRQYPTIMLARVKGSNIVYAWRQARVGAIEPLSVNADKPGFKALLPNVSVNSIALAIQKAQKAG